MNGSIPSAQSDRQTGEKGWEARLDLKIGTNGSQSVIRRSSQRGPLTIQNPFYPEGDLCHLYLLHPPAGIVGGDLLSLNLDVVEGASCLLTTPGATKFYRSATNPGRQIQRFRLEPETSLEWLPQETIYYPDCNAEVETRVELQDGAHFFGWDVHCFGLPAAGKDLAGGRVRIRLAVYRDSRPVILETFFRCPEGAVFQEPYLRDHLVMGSCIATGIGDSLLDQLRGFCGERFSCLWGASLIEDILVVRALGNKTGEIHRLYREIWSFLRPELLGREGMAPRIWAT